MSLLTKGLCRTVMSGLLAFAFTGICAEAAGEVYREPFLSGTTKTWVYVGETYDRTDSRNRVFADDLEDGDLTGRIREISNNVDTSRAGEYKISYEITDADGNTSRADTVVNVVEQADTAEKTVQRTLYTLGDASHLTNISFNRGYFHDRQNLGIWLPEGAELEIRLVNGAEFGQNLRMEFKNQDSLTESSAVIPASGEFVTVRNTFTRQGTETEYSRDSVPFIVTPKCTSVQPVLEFKWNDRLKEIPYYRYKDNEQKFFAEWRQTKAPYAIIEGNSATFLVPIKDMDEIVNSSYASNPDYRFQTIDKMLEWYDAFVKQYDAYAGLDFHAEKPYNQNIRSRFFVKANEHGVGQAYYGPDHSAYNGDSLNLYLTKHWLSLHEFGHGYEGAIASQENPFIETTNNIMGYYFEPTYRSANDVGWLLGGKPGNTIDEKWASLEQRAVLRRSEVQTFSGIVEGANHYDVSLYMFVNALDCLGPEKTVSAMHEQYRENYYNTKKHTSSSDVILESFGKSGGRNMIPYFETWHISPSQRVENRIYNEDYPMVYYLYDLIPDQALAAAVKTKLKLNGVYDLVTTEQLAYTGYKSQVELRIQIDDLKQIENKNILIKNGKEIVKEIPVTSETLFAELPVGIYEVELPAADAVDYDYDNTYLIASKGSAVKELEYRKEKGNPLADDVQIKLLGVGHGMFASASLDSSEGKLFWKTQKATPHAYFENVEYASVKVLDASGKEIFRQSFLGNEKVEEAVREIDFPVGARLEIYHREAGGRLCLSSSYTGENLADYAMNSGEGTAVFVMTKYGLMKEEWDESKRENVYYSCLERYSEFLLSGIDTEALKNADRMHKEKLLIQNAYRSLPEEKQRAYSKKWGVLLGLEGSYTVYSKIPSASLTAVADSESSEENDGAAAEAVDGDESTFWHSNYKGVAQPDIPNNQNNNFTVILSENTDIGKLEYVPRPGGGNGTILSFRLYYSTTEGQEDFQEIPLESFTWEDNGLKKSVEFSAEGARRIRIQVTATGGFRKDTYISAAEFYLYKMNTITVSGNPVDPIDPVKPIDPINPIDPENPKPGKDEQITEIPGKTAGVVIGKNQTQSLYISWNPVQGAAGYEVWRAKKGSASFGKAAEVNTSCFLNTKLENGTSYVYKIRAYTIKEGIHYGEFSDEVWSTTKPPKMKLSKVKKSGKKVLIKWKKNAKAEGIEIWVKQKKGSFKQKKTVTGKKTSVKLNKLKPGKKYTFKIRAYRKDGTNGKVYGAFSKTKTVKL